MKIIIRDPGATGAHHARPGNAAEVRFGITRGEITDDGVPTMVTLVMPRKADVESLAGLFAYAANRPDFGEGEWRLIVEAVRAHALAGHALEGTLEDIANTISRKLGWPSS